MRPHNEHRSHKTGTSYIISNTKKLLHHPIPEARPRGELCGGHYVLAHRASVAPTALKSAIKIKNASRPPHLTHSPAALRNCKTYTSNADYKNSHGEAQRKKFTDPRPKSAPPRRPGGGPPAPPRRPTSGAPRAAVTAATGRSRRRFRRHCRRHRHRRCRRRRRRLRPPLAALAAA